MKVEVKGAGREEVAATIARTSRELRKVVGMVEDLEHVVGLAISLAGRADAEQMQELQKLDHIQQKIQGVADFLEALAGEMPGEWRIDPAAASHRVLLAELGAALGAEKAIWTPSLEPVETYEVF